MKGAKQRERGLESKSGVWPVNGARGDYVETRRKWGVPPRRAWRRQMLRKLSGYGGHAVAQRHTRKSRMHTHERAREHTLPLGAHTSTAHATVRRGDHREEPQAGLGSLSRRAPAKACATGDGSSPPRPAPPRQGAARGGGEGVCPSPLLC